MAKIISTIKATLTRIIFSAHSIIAIYQVVDNKNDIIYWSLTAPLLLLLFEGIFTIFIKKTQEWRWFCPSVFLYLASIVPAIWLLEFDKVERRLLKSSEANDTADSPITDVLGVPKINKDTWITLIEQFLMLILIVGRWMLPKGDLTRDQLSQLLLVYIGTAADIIEFFDSYKDESIAKIPLLVYLTLGIWSWSLLQFTIVLSATRARRPRGGGSNHKDEPPTDCCNNCCCGIDVWGIVLNVILQDAPFLTFRLLIIFQYDIISYMNVFFTCKNSLVIVLQLYRLYVVNAEFWKSRREQKVAAKQRQYKSKRRNTDDPNGIYMISSDRGTEMRRKIKRAKEYSDDEVVYKKKAKKDKNKKRKRKDTGYSTASSQNLYSTKGEQEKAARRKDKKGKKSKRDRSKSPCSSDIVEARKSKHAKKSDKSDKKKSKRIDAVIEESSSTGSSSDSSNSTLPSYEVINEKKSKSKRRKRNSSSSSSTTDSSDNSSSES
ncbi:transmembrane protein 26 [Lucilia sericata]|uniref:transmembrane protein 26 n=1 Tax=Lucilia sericata TaxID=13632 RepID=UPI0018A8619F|nr:transmembrane protein 26 [Lucilia sericata]